MAWRSFQSFNFQYRFIRHQNFLGELTPIQENSNLDRMDATLKISNPAILWPG
ncbi:AbfB domain-containing protein [Bacillus wiedmannii]